MYLLGEIKGYEVCAGDLVCITTSLYEDSEKYYLIDHITDLDSLRLDVEESEQEEIVYFVKGVISTKHKAYSSIRNSKDCYLYGEGCL